MIGVNSCYLGDVRDGLRAFAAAGIRAQTCVTSPPYWGLRDYGVPGQLGLEPTIGEYVAGMVEVFALVRDVLAEDGTLWLNLGDSYAGPWGAQSREHAGKHAPNVSALSANQVKAAGIRESGTGSLARTPGLKAKDLCGIPWRVAFALQADGWYLRSDIIWAKPNPMPESVTDRPTKSHEYLFLLAQSERYYFDAASIREDGSAESGERYAYAFGGGMAGRASRETSDNGLDRRTVPIGYREYDGKRNKRSVWTVPTSRYADAHFATFPPALIEPCILAGSRPGDIVLDPFLGSGTTAQVAQDMGRRWIGCELNPEYINLQRKRTAQTGLALA